MNTFQLCNRNNISQGLKYAMLIGTMLLSMIAIQASAAPDARKFDPVAQDPIVLDKAHPPTVHEVEFDSDGVKLYGKVYSAQGTTPHPTVLIARGYPDMTSSADVALTLQRAGYNAVIFNYRGAWGMGGSFTMENSYQDLRAALGFLRSYQTSKTMLIDPNNVVLFGYSMGGPIALRLAATDAGVRGVLQLDGLDLRAMPTLKPDEKLTWAADLKTLAIPGADGAKIVEDVVDHFNDWNPENYVSGLSGKDVFLLWATRGNGYETHRWGKSLHDLYAAQARVTDKTLDTNHDFSDHRIEVTRATLAWMDKVHFAPASFAQKTASEERRDITIPPDQLLQYVGIYKDSGIHLLYLKAEDGKLWQSDIDREWAPVVAFENGKFSLNDQNGPCGEFSFNKDDKGVIESLTLLCSGRSVTLMRASKELNFPPEPQVVSVPVDVLKTYVGKYRLPVKFQPSSYFVVAQKGDRLTVAPDANNNAPFLLFPTADNKFFSRAVKADVEFVKDDAGAISHIHAKMDDGEYDFPREQ